VRPGDIIDVKKTEEDPLNVPDKAVVPERLKFNAADSDATKLSKKRQIKKIKQNHKKRKLEVENTKKQNNWLNFQKKVPAFPFFSWIFFLDSIFCV